MQPVTLSFLWHFHQPIYRDVRTGRMLMPWPRLHGVKDYTGMALLLEEFPEIRCTANFSPSLLLQIETYNAGGTDSSLELLREPELLSQDERNRILDTFFFAHPVTMIGAYPRYRELEARKKSGERYSPQDFLDLQVLANLAWVHPLVLERDPELAALREKGRGYSREDRALVVAKHREILRELLPRWKRLQPRIEMSVSPFAHPIVPLLCSFQSAGFARLPDPIAGLREDAELHVRRAAEWGERIFGRRPAGMWPSEGAVSEEAARLIAKHGFRWIATDQLILESSLGRAVGPNELYRPWKYGDVTILFRDLEISNLLGFTYKGWKPDEAARDLIRRVEAAPDGAFVSVILDGENAWEHYPGLGVPFFRELYRGLSGHPRIRTAPIGEALEREPARLDRLHAGSWIDRSFRVWIGHEEDIRAWNLLGRTRAAIPADAPPAAWESLYAAEGSDWFWWFGDDFSSAQDAEFDALFRRHLANVYHALGKPEPKELLQPVKERVTAVVSKAPRAMLSVVIDGRRTDYFEWVSAGHYDMSKEYGAMAGELSFLSDLFYGFDAGHLLLRFDFRDGARIDGKTVKLVVTRPHPREIELWPPSAGVRAAVEEIAEFACPFSALGAKPDDVVEFVLALGRIRFPTTVPLSVRVPTKDFEKINWFA